MWKAILLIPFLAFPAKAALSNFWIDSGNFKMARQDRLPYGNCSTCTLTRNWDGDTASIFGAKNETLGFVLYMGNATGADISEVSVRISSFTGPTSQGIVSTPALLSGVTNYANRPIEMFYVRYHQIRGMTQLSWDGTEFEQRDLPGRFRRPCTVDVNNKCGANSNTWWTSRQDHDKFYPEILVPYEAVAQSSFTVSASSSQAIWFDVYVDPSLSSGTYTAQITVMEGVTVSTRIPVELLVYNFTLPDSPNLKTMMYFSNENINYRHYGNKFPASGDPYKNTRQKYAQFIRRHKIAATLGDNLASSCGQSGKNYPCPEYVERLNGSLYTNAQGYYNAPGLNIPDYLYSIGTYGSWPSATWSSTLTEGANGFCVNVSSWSSYFANNFPNTRAFLYLTDEPTVFTTSNKWSTWIATACAQPHTIGSLVTASAVTLQAQAPNVTMPTATTFLRASEAQWQAAADHYTTTGSTQMWAYNSHPPHTGSVYATEDDGFAPVTIFWSMFKKDVQGWYFWEASFWFDNQEGQENNLWDDAMTFGFRNNYVVFSVSGMSTQPTCDYADSGGNNYEFSTSSYTGVAPNIAGLFRTLDENNSVNPTFPPSSGTLTKIPGICQGAACTCTGDSSVTFVSWSSTTVHPVKGSTGFQYSNGDGNLLYPGTDVTAASGNNYGIDGPIASWRLKQLRRGIQDGDYMTAAYAASPAETLAIVNAMVPDVLWEKECFDLGDCSYAYGGRSWPEDPNSWEEAREDLAQIVSVSEPATIEIQCGGELKIGGELRFQ